MDGVLVHEERALPGAADFLERLVERRRRFLVLTNNSIFTPRDLSARLAPRAHASRRSAAKPARASSVSRKTVHSSIGTAPAAR